YARVMEGGRAAHGLRRALFNWGLGAGAERARAGFERLALTPLEAVQAWLADRLVAAKIRARVGGRLRFCISGGAPLAPKVMEFFFAIGIPVIEGYGLTETSPVICLNRPGREKPGSVGPPIPGVEVRIGEDGEILTRGPHVMRGYYKNEAATRAALREGWFRTGDVGHLDGDGCLYITDRLKDLLVTAGGKKVAPQRGRAARRPPPLRGGTAGAQPGQPRSRGQGAGLDFRAARRAAPAPGGAQALSVADRRHQHRSREIRTDQAVRPARARAEPGGGRAHAHAQGQAPRDHGEVRAHHRAALRFARRGSR